EKTEQEEREWIPLVPENLLKQRRLVRTLWFSRHQAKQVIVEKNEQRRGIEHRFIPKKCFLRGTSCGLRISKPGVGLETHAEKRTGRSEVSPYLCQAHVTKQPLGSVRHLLGGPHHELVFLANLSRVLDPFPLLRAPLALWTPVGCLAMEVAASVSSSSSSTNPEYLSTLHRKH
ncbi:hypothetical protein J0S82_012740, partial [Galemys pyrenaicus]